MRLIDRYICRQVFSHAFLGLAIFTFVFFVPQLVRLMDLIVRHPGSWSTIAILFLSTLPGILSLTIPMGVLVGVLIALGRLSADSELIAMSALGMGRRRLLVPVGIIAVGATAITFLMTIWLAPLSVRTFRIIEDRLRAGQASYQVSPRVFDERCPHMVLYVNDIDSAATRWKGVFLADTDKDVTRLTLAEEAIVIADRSEGKLEVHLRNGTVHEFSSSDPGHYSLSGFGERDLPVEVKSAEGDQVSEPGIPGRTMSTLWQKRRTQREASVEIQRRLSFPFACISFALLAMPIGARPRSVGRAAGFLITLILITGYYLMFTIGAGLTRQGTIPIWVGIWSANVITAGLGLFLLPRLERMPGSSRTGAALDWVAGWRVWKIFSREKGFRPAPQNGASASVFRLKRGLIGIPQILDVYLLRSFIYYFVLMTVGFILLFEVFTFFDLLDDISQHRTGGIEV